MAKLNAPLLALNRGLVSSSALARTDVERIRLSAEIYNNWLPKSLGPMMLRPGWQYLTSSKGDAAAQYIPFVAKTIDAALFELTNLVGRILIDDELLERPSVATTISNGSFATSTSWTDSSTGGGTLTFGASGLVLNATNRGGVAKCARQITVAGGDQNIEHGLRIKIGRGPVTFSCGSAAGSDSYITETTLRRGENSLAFTPTGNFHLTFQSDDQIDRIVTSIAVEAAGVVELVSPFTSSDLDALRWEQSADVLFVACEGKQQRRIERRGTGRSWSIVRYASDDGPFSAGRTAKVRLKPAATFGNTTLTSDKPFFKSTHVGAIFRLFHSGYHGTFTLGREDTYTDPIRVTGVWFDGHNVLVNDRDWLLTIAGTWVGTLTVERSFDGPDAGFQIYDSDSDQSGTSTDGQYTANVTNDIIYDRDSNSIIYYRVGFRPGDYTSGAPTITFSYDGGGDFGICRVTGFSSSTSVNIEVLKDFTGITYTEDWREGIWSDYRGWPTEVALVEGRLTWPGIIYWIASVSDAYESFDAEVEGDAGPIIRTLGAGPVDTVNFALTLNQPIIGTASSEITVRSSSFGEILTPQNANAKDASTIGSAQVKAVKVDKNGIYIDRSGQRVYVLLFDPNEFDYVSDELTKLVPDLAEGTTITQIAVQRKPDTRIHLVFANGLVSILTYQPKDELLCFSMVETDGFIERVAILPGIGEDQVYYHVRRTIGVATKRYLEKWALENECIGGALNKQLDSFVAKTPSSTFITGLDHLEDKDVAVWANGVCLEDADGDIELFTVSGGSVTLPQSYINRVAGLPYTAQYKSTKLAYAAQLGTALTQRKTINFLALILENTHHKGLRFGRDFDNMDTLSQMKDGAPVAAGTIHAEYDNDGQSFPGRWSTDARLCLEANAPRPVTVLGAVVSMDVHERS